MAEDILLRLKGENADLRAKLAEAQAGVQKLHSSVDGLNAASKGGGGVSDLTDKLDELKDRLYNTERAHEANVRELAAHKQSLLDAAKAAKENTGALGGLFDGLSKLQKGFAFVGGAILAFKTSFNQTRNVIKFFHEQFGLDIDALVAKAINYDKIAEKILGLGDAQKNAAKDSEFLKNAINVLDNLGIKHSGTIEDVTAKYEAWAASHQKVVQGTEATNASFEKFQKTVTGFTLDELKAELEDILSVQAKLAEQGKDKDGPFADAQRARIEKVTAAIKALGTEGLSPELLARFTNLADETTRLTEAQDDLVKSTGASVEALEKQRATVQQNAEAISALASDSGAISDLIGKFEELEQSQSPDRVADIKSQIADLTAEYDALGAAVTVSIETFDRQAEIQDEIRVLTGQIGDAQQESFDAFDAGARDQIQAQNQFSQLLVEYESKIKDLPENVRGPLEAVILRFRGLNSAVGASKHDVEVFEATWKAALGRAGLQVGDLSLKVTSELGKAQTEFAAVKLAAEDAFAAAASSVGPFNAALDGTIGKMNDIIQKAPAVASAVEQAFGGGASPSSPGNTAPPSGFLGPTN